MSQKIYQVDAFADRLFAGNPAAVCPLDRWPDDQTMQNIARENNLAEAAFYVKRDGPGDGPSGDQSDATSGNLSDGDQRGATSDTSSDGRGGAQYEIRWFTPAVEVDLCGHATLAAGFVLLTLENHPGGTVVFHSPRSGRLAVTKTGETLSLDFPADTYAKTAPTAEIIAGFDIRPNEVYRGKTDYMLVYDSEAQIRAIRPRLAEIAKLDGRGVIVTAPGEGCDFVSRFFAPQSGIDEDPVTGSAHTTLTPYWAGRLGKNELSAMQFSERGGRLRCRLLGDRVVISGECRLYLSGELHLSDELHLSGGLQLSDEF